MTLLTKTTLLYLVVALVVFGIGGVGAYHLIKGVVDKETDYYLVRNYRRIQKSIKEGQPIETLKTDGVSIKLLDNNQIYDTTAVFSDTIKLHYHWDRLEPHRMLSKITQIENRFFQISLMDVIVESDDVYKGVVQVLTWLFLGLSATLLIFGFFIGRKLFQPFQKILTSIRSFNVKDDSEIPLQKTNTKEFKQLNAFVYTMKDKARRDYRALKEFTENASHEMQTPVAIAKGKLELLLNSGDLSEKQMQLIQSASDSLNRLSRISNGLSLLNKIDNGEFQKGEQINFSKTVQSNIKQFEELALLKGISIQKELAPEVILPANSNIAEILVSNLLKNAIHHNEQDGWINIHLDKNKLKVENSGKAPKHRPELLFERFRKGNQSNGSLGLGLAIVKKICKVNGWEVNYHYQQEKHVLEVEF